MSDEKKIAVEITTIMHLPSEPDEVLVEIIVSRKNGRATVTVHGHPWEGLASVQAAAEALESVARIANHPKDCPDCGKLRPPVVKQ